MKLLDRIVELLAKLLPFLRRKDAKELKEFSELITQQYGFLVGQLEKALYDYFELSDRVKVLHTEIVALRQQLAAALPERCLNHTCAQRIRCAIADDAERPPKSDTKHTPKADAECPPKADAERTLKVRTSKPSAV